MTVGIIIYHLGLAEWSRQVRKRMIESHNSSAKTVFVEHPPALPGSAKKSIIVETVINV